MKTNKVLKWLYGVFMFLPMLAIGVTCAYVTFNKNAKDSYSDTYVENIDKINTNNLIANQDYIFTYRSGSTITDYSPQYYYSNINIDWSNYSNFNNSQVGGFRFYPETSTSVNEKIALYQSDGTYLGLTNNVWGTTLTTFTIKYIESRSSTNYQPLYDLYFVTYQVNKLDNAFYYAVDQFNESGFNKIDFVSFFDMFYENTNIWTTFANTYMNYVLFVSLAFFIPRVLYWFINLAFSLTDSFERKSQGW